MKYLPIVLLSIVFHVQCRSLSPSKFKILKENDIGFDEERSARVHRVSDDGYPSDSITSDESYIPISGAVEKVISDQILEYPNQEKELIVPGERKLENIMSEVLQKENNSNDYEQREGLQVEIVRRLMQIFKELPAGESSKLKNFSVTISEVKDSIGQLPHKEYVSNNIDTFQNLVDSPKKLDIHYQDNQMKKEHEKSRYDDLSKSSSISHFELMNVQSQMKRIRNDFEKLCRKHHIDDGNRS